MRIGREYLRGAGEAACFFGGGGGTTSTNTVQNTTPWSVQQPYLASIYSQAGTLDQTAVPQYYPNDTYAPLTPLQNGLMSNVISTAATGGSPAIQGAENFSNNLFSPGYTATTSPAFSAANSTLTNEMAPGFLNPANSPSYQTAVSNAIASAVPNATAGFAAGNRSDSGLASAAATSAAANAAGGLAQTQYNTQQQLEQQAVAQASQNQMQNQQQQVQGMFYAPFVDQQAMGNLGTALNTAGMQQQNQQNQINANVARYNYGQMLPWNQLGMFESAITGAGSPGSSTSSMSQQPYFTNPVANVASAATGLGALGYLGYLAFSDRRLKDDIQRVGVSDSGFPLYSFRYKWEGPMSRHIGVMAQDVELFRPDAVVETPIGKAVDYRKALAA
ncbi:MAG: tail fiber domain-containing protein [Bradyrhizobium sp.]|nr:tail fiber domain-containing protein [Bradyrhizobium sp.]